MDERVNDKNVDILKDMAYNLRRLVLVQGGGRWLGSKLFKIEPKKDITIYFHQAQSSVLVIVHNTSYTEDVYLSPDPTIFKDPKKVDKTVKILKPGQSFRLVIEYMEGIYAFNPGNTEAVIEVDTYAIRDCHFFR